jgi:hypothetical protein
MTYQNQNKNSKLKTLRKKLQIPLRAEIYRKNINKSYD